VRAAGVDLRLDAQLEAEARVAAEPTVAQLVRRARAQPRQALGGHPRRVEAQPRKPRHERARAVVRGGGGGGGAAVGEAAACDRLAQRPERLDEERLRAAQPERRPALALRRRDSLERRHRHRRVALLADRLGGGARAHARRRRELGQRGRPAGAVGGGRGVELAHGGDEGLGRRARDARKLGEVVAQVVAQQLAQPLAAGAQLGW